MKEMKGKSLKKILRYIKPYRISVVFSIICAALTVMFTLYVPMVIGDMIDLMVGVGEVDLEYMMHLFVRGLVCAGAASLFQWISGSLNNRIAFGVMRDVRRDAFNKLHRLPLSYLDTHPSGETVSRVIADVETLSDGLLLGFSNLFSGVATIIGTLVVMFVLSPTIAAVVVILTPMSFLVAKYISSRTYGFFKAQTESRGEQTAVIDEYIGGIRTVKAFGYESDAIKIFDKTNDKLSENSLKAIFFSSLTNPSTRFVNAVVYAAVVLCGGFTCIATAGTAAAFSVGSLSVLLQYAGKFAKPFNEISGVITEFQNAIACATRVIDLIDEPDEPKDGELILPEADGEVRLDNVSFSYDKSRTLLTDISLSVKPGQRVAIVGPTGCGKTTLINLLMRFYDVDDGSVSVDGKDIRDVTRASLRQSYGMVLQETWLLTATVRENIAMAKPDATDEEIIAAAKASHADSFIRRLPKGYDTVISDDYGLSQGQKQLLCISRIMLRLPPMLILDEATSSIDTRTEMKIQNAFARLMQGRTSFIVAHRLSTIRESDVILVMKDGNIIEQGRHEELLKNGGFYHKLYNSQFES